MVRIEVLRHGLTEQLAYEVESAAIDLLGFDDLTNRVIGHGTANVGRMGVDDVNALLGASPVEFDPAHKVVLIRVAREFRARLDDDALYEATRRWWRIGAPQRAVGGQRAPTWAMAVYRGVVRAVYRIDGSEPAPEDWVAAHQNNRGRWGFWGVRDLAMEAAYVFSDVTACLPQAAQNPIRYINCRQVNTSGEIDGQNADYR